MTIRTSTLRHVAMGVAAAGMLASAPAAFAATSAQLTLTGTVQQILEITVSPLAAATGLDLTGTATALRVANVNAKSNASNGYTVDVTSLNQQSGDCTTANGPCFHSASATSNDDLAFTLLRNQVAVPFTGAEGEFVSTTSRSAVGGDQYDARISYDGSTVNLDQATDYSETLTFTVAVN